MNFKLKYIFCKILGPKDKNSTLRVGVVSLVVKLIMLVMRHRIGGGRLETSH